jgi:hypothetical protein
MMLMPRQPRFLTLTLLACALFLRAWVPAGWMPAPGGGAFAIEPCPAAAPVPMVHAHGAHHGSHKGQHDSDCSFAPHHAGAAEIAQPPTFVAPTIAAAALPEHFAAPAFATGPPAPPPPATGPPSIA